MTIHQELIDWYWQYGVQRKGKYTLGPGDWLDQLYRSLRISETVEGSRAAPRPAMALWGTSQTGKSTLLSSYLDRPGDASGERSALSWPGGTKVRFCKDRSSDSPPPETTTVMNPYNFKGDASGCISRFRLADGVADPKHPIEIRLASPVQLMHALAMGYLTECRLERSEGDELQLTVERLGRELDHFEETERRAGILTPGGRESYDALHRVADLLETLVLSGYSRYSALARNLPAARSRILDCQRLLGSCEAVDRLAAQLFWDGQETLSQLYRGLVSWADRRRRAWGNRPVFGSPAVVAMLLDVETYKRLHLSDTKARMEGLLRELKADVKADRVNIGTTAGAPLVDDPEDFSWFQGVVLELIIPVRRDAVQDRSDFLQFLSEADLLDFPGTGRDHDNRETRLNLAAITPAKRHQLFTKVLKRGKTASIVATYARNLTIDGFSILAKVMDNPGQPGQLSSGIATWWKSFGSEPGSRPGATRSRLPLNLVMSFWGAFLRDAIHNGVRDQGIDPIFQKLHTLDKLANPEVVSCTLAVNYAEFDEGKLPDPSARFTEVVREVMERAEFRRQFRTERERESFRAMVEDGGTDFLFRVLHGQSRESPRSRLLDDCDRERQHLLIDLFDRALPGEDDGAKNREAVALWAERLDSVLVGSTDEDPAGLCSRAVRRMLDVPPERLEAVPGQLRERRADPAAYLETQFLKWVEHARAAVRDDLDRLGFVDADHARHCLFGLLEGVDQRGLCDWLAATLGHVQSKAEGESARRYLALRMTDALFPTIRARSHRSREAIVAEMERYEARELSRPDYRSSPHYRQFLDPFITYLRVLGEGLRPDGRPSQPGDSELEDIKRRHPLD